MTLRPLFVLLAIAAIALGQEEGSDLKAAAVRLRQGTTIPLRLPPKMPDLGQGNDPLYAIVELAKPTAYSVIIGFTPDCNGASVCRAGTLAARRLPKARAPRGKKVTLVNGVSGSFREGTCAAGCADSVVEWLEGNVQYSVGVKAGSQDDVTKLANIILRNKS